jgi:N-acetyl-gamma-glutamyl-phosphate reductase
VSATLGTTAIEADRRAGSDAAATPGRPARDTAADPIRVAIVGATGYVGAELVRLLSRHPSVRIVGLVGRDRNDEPIETFHPQLVGTGLTVGSAIPADAETVFLALPHGAAAQQVPALVERGISIIDMGPDFRLHDPADYPIWYGFEHPSPQLLDHAVYGLPELHRAELQALAGARRDGRPVIVGSPGCYPTTTILALAPLARAGLIGDLVVDAKSGVSGAGKDPKPNLHFGEVDESVSAYGLFTHRHTAELEQELGALSGGAEGTRGIDFLPHLIPMVRGILSSSHVRPTRPVTQPELDDLYADAYADEPFVTVVGAPPATKHVTGSNEARVHVRVDPRTGRVLALGVLDNLVKGAAGQGVQAFNLVWDLPETAGLLQAPLAP